MHRRIRSASQAFRPLLMAGGLTTILLFAGCDVGIVGEGRASSYAVITSCPVGVTCPDSTSTTPPTSLEPSGGGGSTTEVPGEETPTGGDGSTGGGSEVPGGEVPGGEVPGGSGGEGGEAPPTTVFCTYTQGGWGTACRGGNPGCVRDAGFDIAFPSGLVVGSGNSMTFTTSAAVQAYLPAGGPASALTRSYTDPTSTEAGVLGGQLTSVKLAVGLGDAGVMPQPTSVGNLQLIGGAFDGLSVRELVELADRAIGGDAGALDGRSLSQLNEALAGINEDFDECRAVN